MKPDWDESSPQLAENIVRVLGLARAHAIARKKVSVALMRAWHGEIMAGLGLEDPGWAACFRGEGAAKLVGVGIGGLDGVAPARVGAELEAFEARLVQIVATLDAAIGEGGTDSEDEIGAVIDSCAWAHGEWVRIHPFANGSGRTARLWVNYLALRYGLPRFARMRPRPDGAYAAAARAGMTGNWKAMKVTGPARRPSGRPSLNAGLRAHSGPAQSQPRITLLMPVASSPPRKEFTMFRKLSLATAAAAATLTLVPAAAQANHRSGYHDSGRYQQNVRGDRYGRYDSRYYGRSNVRYNGRRCKGTTGLVVGGVAGALLGRTVTRDRYRGRSGTTGAILGGAIGALAGRAVQKSSCR